MIDLVVQRLRAAGCVFAEEEAWLLIDAARDDAELDALVERRAGGEPLEPLLGWAEFGGLRIAIDPGVFVPRRRTELLARQAIAHARPAAVVLDLCCGSGAIGAVLLARFPGLDLYAVDVEPAAARCARRNVAAARVLEGDLFAPLPGRLRGRVDVIAANAPYVPTDEIALMPAEARDHEPRVALDGGADGGHVHRRVAAEAPSWLAPGGCLLIETSRRQSSATAAAVGHAGLTVTIVVDDELDATVVIGRRTD